MTQDLQSSKTVYSIFQSASERKAAAQALASQAPPAHVQTQDITTKAAKATRKSKKATNGRNATLEVGNGRTLALAAPKALEPAKSSRKGKGRAPPESSTSASDGEELDSLAPAIELTSSPPGQSSRRVATTRRAIEQPDKPPHPFFALKSRPSVAVTPTSEAAPIDLELPTARTSSKAAKEYARYWPPRWPTADEQHVEYLPAVASSRSSHALPRRDDPTDASVTGDLMRHLVNTQPGTQPTKSRSIPLGMDDVQTWFPSQNMRRIPLIARLTEQLPQSSAAEMNRIIRNCRASSRLWTETFAPSTAEQMLGETNRASAAYLRDWLNELTLRSMQAAPCTDGRTTPIRQTKKRTVIRQAADQQDDETNDATDALTNLIVLCGQSGTGKTASVHAVAKELGFEIFEVFPGIGKRSAKDIERYVGDIGRNHLVRNVASPRRAAMRTPPQSPSRQPILLDTPNSPIRNRAGQSLILLEEADILFESDLGFWDGVIQLASISHRPIIVTCNDLSLVPRDLLPIQEILYYEAPPLQETVALVQTAALLHGVLIQKEDLSSLYRSTRYRLAERLSPSDTGNLPLAVPPPGAYRQSAFDIRKLLSDLQFLCLAPLLSTSPDLVDLIEIALQSRPNNAMTDQIQLITGWNAECEPSPEMITGALESQEALDEQKIDDELAMTYIASKPNGTCSFAIELDVLDTLRDCDFIRDWLLPDAPNELSETSFASARSEHAIVLDTISNRFMDSLAPLLPHPAVASLYIPYIRSMVMADEARKTAAEAESDLARVGRRRSTRISGVQAVMKFQLEEDVLTSIVESGAAFDLS
ncbi:hypothetical protein E5Q_01373 [Mixia osmundae IAM 14324]|uniref:AAA+ ATPase domain-containing protein n=1 Tax=Mixia osmundae (strain CBS 9802 / IAM 14324 / JCM 22182 / KY 12970) TaxID=764103 RepID=G7DVW0_MIXOS|nr:hypothetical protein E5Q_01373 [Mixia osmundae IAM 14324]